MKNQRRKKTVLGILFLVIGMCGVLAAQVLNEKYYNMEARFVRAAGMISLEKGNSEPTYIATIANNTDLMPTRLLNAHANARQKEAVCYTFDTSTDDWGPIVNQSLGVISRSTTGSVDYDILSWEDDGGKRCVWNEGIDDNANREFGSLHLPIYLTVPRAG